MATMVIAGGAQTRSDDDLVYISNTIKPLPTKHRHVPSERKGFGSQQRRFRGNIVGVPPDKGSGPHYHSALGDSDVGLDGYEGSGIWGSQTSPLKASRSRLGTSSFAPRVSSPQNLRMMEMMLDAEKHHVPMEPSQYNETRLKELSDLRERTRPDSMSPGPGTYATPTQFRKGTPVRAGSRMGGRAGSPLRAESSAPSLLGGGGAGGRSPAVVGRDTPGPGEYDPGVGERRRFERESVKSTVLAGNTGHSRSRPKQELKAPSISTTLHWGRDWRTLMPFGVERPPRPHSVAGMGPPRSPPGKLPPRPSTTAPSRGLGHPRGHGGISAYLSPYSSTPSSQHRLRKANHEHKKENPAPLVSFRTGTLRPNPAVDRALSTPASPGAATWSASRAGSAYAPSPAHGLHPGFEDTAGSPSYQYHGHSAGTPSGLGGGGARAWGPESYETPPRSRAGTEGGGVPPSAENSYNAADAGVTEAAWHAQKAMQGMQGRFEWQLRSKMVASGA